MIALVDRIKKTAPNAHRRVKIDNVKNKSICTKRSNKPPIPAPEPPGMGAEYADLWNRAWALADYIDNPDGAPIEARRAKLPELDRMRDRLAEIERQGYGGRFDLSEA